eukprot:1155443-Pelagomonas_calceolata.AAC.1
MGVVTNQPADSYCQALLSLNLRACVCSPNFGARSYLNSMQSKTSQMRATEQKIGSWEHKLPAQRSSKVPRTQA